ncbi:MAG: hypothetical protein E7307_04265 [Butyrivibrio sp.]|nr:hypothetical protein [Butyrivibrio sp.]
MRHNILFGTISKRVLAQALAVMMAVTAVPVNTVAAEDSGALASNGQEDFVEDAGESAASIDSAGEIGGELGNNNGFDNDGNSGGELGDHAGYDNGGSSDADGGTGNGEAVSASRDGADYGADEGEGGDGLDENTQKGDGSDVSADLDVDAVLKGTGSEGAEQGAELLAGAEDLENTEFTLLAGEGSFDREELLALLEDASEIEDADLAVEGLKPAADFSAEEINEFKIYVTKGQTFEDAVVFVDADSDGIIDNALALDKLPKPVRDDYDFVCWYLEKYESEDLSGLLSVNKITEETNIDDILAREDLDSSEDNGIELHAVWKLSAPPEMDPGDGVKGSSEMDPGDGVMGSSESSGDGSSENLGDGSEDAADDASDEATEGASDDSIGETSEAAEPEETVEDEAGAGSGEEEPEENPEDVLLVTNVEDEKGIWIKLKDVDNGETAISESFTGSAITFSGIKIYDGEESAENEIPSSNYSVAYKNNKNAGTATITVTFKNNYSGKLSRNFSITPIELSKTDTAFTIPDEVVLSYTGKLQKSVPVIIYQAGDNAAVTLKNNTDFTLDYPYTNPKAADYRATYFVGTPEGDEYNNKYPITVKGKGNFTGEIAVQEYILTSDLTAMSKATVTAEAVLDEASILAADSLDKVPNPRPSLTVRFGSDEPLVEGTDYTFTYENNLNTLTGKAVITSTGTGSFYGTKEVTYKITGAIQIKKAQYGNPQDAIYAGPGTEHKQALMYGETSLIEGIHYKVDYKSGNSNAGTIAATYTGINGFTGSVKKTFKVVARNINDSNITFSLIAADGYSEGVYPYAKGGTKPVTVVAYKYSEGDPYTLKPGVDYTVSYANNSAVGNTSKPPKVTIKGKGNFTGSRSLDFTIVASKLYDDDHPTHLSMNIADKLYTAKPGNYTTTFTITDSDGKKLAAGTDYEKAFIYRYTESTKLVNGINRDAGVEVQSTDIVPVGTVIEVTAIGKGKYTGEISGRYRIISGDISKASVRVYTQYYQGKECRPSYDQIEVKMSGVILSSDDYDITGYANNNAKGKASLTISGKGDYGGKKTVNFTIAVKGVNEKLTVIFNGNGSTSGSMSNQSIAQNASATLTANKFKRTGYRLDPAATWKDAGGQTYQDKKLITNNGNLNTKTLVLYANWIPEKYTVSCHVGGLKKNDLFAGDAYAEIRADESFGYDDVNDIYTFSYSTGDAAITLPTPGRSTWITGYQFGGWYKEESYKTRISVIKKGTSGNLNLYAKWVPYTYVIRFNKNGGDEISGTMPTETFSYGVAKALSPNKFKHSNKIQFAGWAKSQDRADAGIVDFADKEIVDETVIASGRTADYQTAPIDLYAVWKNDFDVNFITNGGVVDATVVTVNEEYKTTYAYGTGLAGLPDAERENYVFAGWCSDSSFAKQVKTIGKKEMGDRTLYAKWEFKISFDGNGATGGVMPDQAVCDADAGFRLSVNRYSNDGKVFVGWAFNPDAETAVYADSELFGYDADYELDGKDKQELFNHGLKLYALWKDWEDYRESTDARDSYGKSYKITFYSNKPDGAQNPSGSMKAEKMIYGTEKALSKNTFKLKGYRFAGWSMDSKAVFDGQYNQYPTEVFPDCALKADFGGYSSNIALFAIWVKEEYSITYKNIDDLAFGQELAPTKFTVSDSFVLITPYRVGAVFDGWYSDAGLKKKVTAIKKGTVGNQVFYAKWRSTRYTINYVLNADDATLDTTNAGYLSSYGDMHESGYVLATAYRPAETWSAFGGWYKDPACKKAAGLFITDLSSDITLYAKWIPSSFSIKFDKNNEYATGVMKDMTGLKNNTPYKLSKCLFTSNYYTMLGWSKEKNLNLDDPDAYTKLIDVTEEDPCPTVTAEMLGVEEGGQIVTLYAVWTVTTFEITYMDGAREFTDNDGVSLMTPVSYTFEDEIQELRYTGDESGIPKRANYAFQGWYTDKNLSVPVGTPAIPLHSYGDKVFYAKWTFEKPEKPDDPEKYIDVTKAPYNAIPDDGNDDTAAINSALAKAYGASASNPCNVYIPSGTYDITAKDRHSIKILSNTNLFMEDETILKVTGKNVGSGDIGMIGLNDVGNIVISGGQLDGGGNLVSHQEAVHGVLILGSHDVSIVGMKIYNNWGDGAYLGWTNYKVCNNITFMGCEIYGNRRNNISIITADNTTIDECYIHDAKGAQPQAGICVEPNAYKMSPTGPEEYYVCDGITIKNTTITTPDRDNWRYRTFYTYHHVAGSNKKIATNITFENVHFYGWYGNYNGTQPAHVGTIDIQGTKNGPW